MSDDHNLPELPRFEPESHEPESASPVEPTHPLTESQIDSLFAGAELNIHEEDTSEIQPRSDEAAGSDTPESVYDPDLDVPFTDSQIGASASDSGENIDDASLDQHEQATLPFSGGHQPSDEPSDPKKTLPGSGGLDPNPDMTPGAAPPTRTTPGVEPSPQELGYTVPHIVPFEHTLVHVPGEESKKQSQDNKGGTNRQQPAPAYQQIYRQSPQRHAPTIPNMNIPPANPNQQPTIPGQYPAPGQTYAQEGYTQPSAPGATGYMPPPPMPGQGGGVPQNVIPRRPKPRRILGCTPGCVAIFAGVFITFCGGLTLITLILTATLGARLEETLTQTVAQVEDYDNFESTFFYDRNGTLLYEAFSEGRRTNVQYEDFPQHLINATIAIEDDSFFSNPGLEVQATIRAFAQYVGLSEGASGGSTITQQLVRNVLFDFEYRAERSVQRKVEEILLAYLLTQRMSKQDILAMYLNEIYYGNLSYGAAAAARTFFDKDVQDLTLAEAALLAGLPQAPASLDPLNPDPTVQNAVAERWRLVLDRMVEERMITADERNQALREGYSINPPDAPLRAPHFTVYAQSELEQLLIELGYSPEDIARGGLRVYTTVDLRLQDFAQEAARSQVSSLGGLTISNAAVVVLQPITGEIMAMVGSIDYNNDAIDGRVNVTIAPRQPGSTMKPLTYAAALERGMTLGDIIWDTEIVFSDYRPVNYDRTFHGPVRIRTALANSYNIPAVNTLRDVGVEGLMEMASRLGIESLGDDPSQYGLSLTLGGGEVTLLELTRAYSVFANNGIYVPTTSILCILDNNDSVLYQYENGCPRGNTTANTVNEAGYGTPVLDPRIAFMITDILSDNAARTPAMGANSPLNTGGLFTAVKTGTTDDFRDNWTVGYNRNVAVGVWVGNSDGTPMSSGTTGLTGAAPIWNAVINGVYNTGVIDEFTVDGGRIPDRLDQPSGLYLQGLCPISTLRDPATDCTASLQEWFMDSPPAYPDGQGGLIYPQPTPPPDQNPPASGVWMREIQPDIYQVTVHPIPPEIGNAIIINYPGAQAQPPAPIYCQVPVELAQSDPAARDQLFIAPPSNPEDAARAEQYARANGIAFLPTIACNSDLISASGGGASVITAFLTQPSPGMVVYPNMPILGTVNFTPQQAEYFKIELSGGQFGDNVWVTLGEVKRNPVINGQLEILPALQPGNYMMQLVVVGLDGNFVQPPYQVPFVVQ